jgi:hypothetical protein
VRLGHGHDIHAVVLGLIQVYPNVAARVYHRSLPGGLTTYEIARLSQIFVVDSREKHLLNLAFVLTVF